MRYAIAWASRPLGFLIAGPLVEKIFDPFMIKNNSTATIFLQSFVGSDSEGFLGNLCPLV